MANETQIPARKKIGEFLELVKSGISYFDTLGYDPLVAVSSAQVQNYDLSKDHSNISMANVLATDHYRKGKAYRLLGIPGVSCIKVTFNIPTEDKATLLCLHHCRTTTDAVISIIVNDEGAFKKFADAPRYNFQYQLFHIPEDWLKQGENSIVFLLDASSPATYWLSDISILPVRLIGIQ